MLDPVREEEKIEAHVRGAEALAGELRGVGGEERGVDEDAALVDPAVAARG